MTATATIAAVRAHPEGAGSEFPDWLMKNPFRLLPL
jgi:hypothetical protein